MIPGLVIGMSSSSRRVEGRRTACRSIEMGESLVYSNMGPKLVDAYMAGKSEADRRDPLLLKRTGMVPFDRRLLVFVSSLSTLELHASLCCNYAISAARE